MGRPLCQTKAFFSIEIQQQMRFFHERVQIIDMIATQDDDDDDDIAVIELLYGNMEHPTHLSHHAYWPH